MLVGPTIVGIFVLIIVNLLTGSYPAAFFGFLLGAVAGAGLFASLIFHPADTVLPAAIDEAESQNRLANARLKEKIERLTETKLQLQKLVDERRDQIASGKLQKAALLQRNWKNMSDPEWEDFVVEVCRTLGAKAERTMPASSGKDANLLVDFGSHRVAVLTQAMITTFRATRSNRSSRPKNGIGLPLAPSSSTAALPVPPRTSPSGTAARPSESAEFPDFVMGKLPI